MIHANGQWKTKKALREAAMPKLCISNPNGPGVCATHGKGFAAGGRCVDGRIGR